MVAMRIKRNASENKLFIKHALITHALFYLYLHCAWFPFARKHAKLEMRLVTVSVIKVTYGVVYTWAWEIF